jgi:hypothetical protein
LIFIDILDDGWWIVDGEISEVILEYWNDGIME